MSYCRWSSMNWRCDVYVYEHVSKKAGTHWMVFMKPKETADV